MLYKATKFKYTHVSLVIDEPFREMYSFGRRILNYPLVGGFVVEKLRGGFYDKLSYTTCVVYKLTVTDEQYLNIKNTIGEFIENYRKYKYSFIGLATIKFGIAWERKYRFTCSQFVAYVLKQSGILNFNKKPSLITPYDFYILGLHEIFNGDLKRIYNYSTKIIAS